MAFASSWSSLFCVSYSFSLGYFWCGRCCRGSAVCLIEKLSRNFGFEVLRVKSALTLFLSRAHFT